jgi:hypothetical protein
VGAATIGVGVALLVGRAPARWDGEVVAVPEHRGVLVPSPRWGWLRLAVASTGMAIGGTAMAVDANLVFGVLGATFFGACAVAALAQSTERGLLVTTDGLVTRWGAKVFERPVPWRRLRTVRLVDMHFTTVLWLGRTVGQTVTIPTTQLAVEPEVVRRLVLHYLRCPEDRDELADGRALERVRATSFSDPPAWPSPGPRGRRGCRPSGS